MTANGERVYTLEGMTCGHRRTGVAEEVGAVPGAAVDVDLATGRLTVRGEGFADEAVVAAVVEAGYDVRP